MFFVVVVVVVVVFFFRKTSWKKPISLPKCLVRPASSDFWKAPLYSTNSNGTTELEQQLRATVNWKATCLHTLNVALEQLAKWVWFCKSQSSLLNTHFFVYKNAVYPAQAECSYFSVDFRLKINVELLIVNYEL